MSNKFAPMPDCATMMSALRADYDDAYVSGIVYPGICTELAGKRTNGKRVVEGILKGSDLYSGNLTARLTQTQDAVDRQMRRYITAVTPANIRPDALAIWDKVRRRWIFTGNTMEEVFYDFFGSR